MPVTINGITLDDHERQPTEIFCRVMGYYRPITVDAFKTTEYNIGKVQEFFDRTWFRIDKIIAE